MFLLHLHLPTTGRIFFLRIFCDFLKFREAGTGKIRLSRRDSPRKTMQFAVVDFQFAQTATRFVPILFFRPKSRKKSKNLRWQVKTRRPEVYWQKYTVRKKTLRVLVGGQISRNFGAPK